MIKSPVLQVLQDGMQRGNGGQQPAEPADIRRNRENQRRGQSVSKIRKDRKRKAGNGVSNRSAGRGNISKELARLQKFQNLGGFLWLDRNSLCGAGACDQALGGRTGLSVVESTQNVRGL